MATACTHPIATTPRIARPVTLPSAQGLAARLRSALDSLADALSAPERPAERTYAALLEGSGGKFTDALEREADRRLRGGWDTFSAP